MQGRHVEHGTGTSRRHYRLRWTHRRGLGRRQFRRVRPRCGEAIPLRGRDRTLAGDTRVLVHIFTRLACSKNRKKRHARIEVHHVLYQGG